MDRSVCVKYSVIVEMAAAGAGGAGAGGYNSNTNNNNEDDFISTSNFQSLRAMSIWPKQLGECMKEINKMLEKLNPTNPITVSLELIAHGEDDFNKNMTVKITVTAQAGFIGKRKVVNIGRGGYKNIDTKEHTFSFELPNIRKLYLSGNAKGKTRKDKLQYIYRIISLDILAAIYKYILANNYHITGHLTKLLEIINDYISKTYRGDPDLIKEIKGAFDAKGGTDKQKHTGGPDIFKEILTQTQYMLTESDNEAPAAGGAAAGAAGGHGMNVDSEEELGGGRRRRSQTKRKPAKRSRKTRRRR